MKTKIYLIILILIALAWFTPVRVENVASSEHRQHLTRAEYWQWQHKVFLLSEK